MPPINSFHRLFERTAWGLLFLTVVGTGTRPGMVEAQTITLGELQGTARDELGDALPSVAVTINERGSDASVLLETNISGQFDLPFLEPGDYDVLFEAAGFRPRLVRGARVRPGRTSYVEAALIPDPPPVESVDTVFASTVSTGGFGPEAGRWVSRTEIARFLDRRESVVGLATLSGRMDEALGWEGLPGRMSAVFVDGIPVTTMSHPNRAGSPGTLLLPRLSLAGLGVGGGLDAEWGNTAGGSVRSMTRAGTPGGGVELLGYGSGGGLWQSEALSDQDAPSAFSGWIDAGVDIPLDSEAASWHVAVEGAYDQRPYPSTVSSELAAAMEEARPGIPGLTASELTDPWLESYRSISALTRFDWNGDDTDVTGIASFANIQDEGERPFEPPLSYISGGPREGTDMLVGGSLLTRVQDNLAIETRASFQRFDRSWESMDPAGIPSTRFLDAGERLGPETGLDASAARSAFTLSTTAHFELNDTQSLKFGLAGSYAQHTIDQLYGSGGSWAFGTPERLEAGDGAVRWLTSPASESSFAIPELALYAQHVWQPTSSLEVTSALRYDRESLPRDDVPVGVRWGELALIGNDGFEEALAKFGPRLSVRWDATGEGRAVIHGFMGADHGRIDPYALHEVITLSGGAIGHEQVGDLDAWPDLPSGSTATRSSGIRMALFGPELKAPRTVRSGLGIAGSVGGNLAVGALGTFRRTDFLLRRADLNLAVAPSERAIEGRPAYGVPVKTGSVIVAAPGSNRRIDEFEIAWARNADGFSEYVGATLYAEYRTGYEFDLFGSYTFSRTQDNLLGGRSGIPEAEISPHLGEAAPDWDEDTSDFDQPHRLVTGMLARIPVLEGLDVSAVYRLSSGFPYTAGYRTGVDINGDGSAHNDPALVPNDLSAISSENASCLSPDRGRIATRNACRGDAIHELDLHFSLNLFRFGGRVGALAVDVLNVMDTDYGAPDSALLLVDPDGSLEEGSDSVGVPLTLNSSFGQVTQSFRPGRLIRIGFRLEAPR